MIYRFPVRHWIRLTLDVFLVSYATVCFLFLRKRPVASHRLALMRLHCATNAFFTDLLAQLLAKVYGKRKAVSVTGLLGNFSLLKQSEIVDSLNREGYYIFENKLSSSLCDRIRDFAAKTPAKIEGRGTSPSELEVFNPIAPSCITYRLQENTISEIPEMQMLMSDPVFLAIAEGYIGATPMLSMLNLWWSTAFGTTPGSDAAQMFHFDFDPPPKWLLFFVYLTDVGTDNGPHVFVRGSHKSCALASRELLSRGYVRISDEEITKAFGLENVVEILGGQGTVIAVDTRGFHKGKMLNEGSRLMAQLTFSYPVFSGAHGEAHSLKFISPDLAQAARKSPKTFTRYIPSE